MPSRWRRVAFIAACAATPLFAGAQSAAKIPRVAIVNPSAPLADMHGPKPTDGMTAGIVERLRELGYVEGRTIYIERRSAEGQRQRLPGLLREVVDLRVDVIVAGGPAAVEARRATSTIPIVADTSS
jgi:putative ABC transport system substrate-binding protein